MAHMRASNLYPGPSTASAQLIATVVNIDLSNSEDELFITSPYVAVFFTFLDS